MHQSIMVFKHYTKAGLISQLINKRDCQKHVTHASAARFCTN